jgi:predicted nucleic acid-binding protein
MSLYLLDTNILLGFVNTASPERQLVFDAVSRLVAQRHKCVITGQVLVEFWVVATRPKNVNGFAWTVEKTSEAVDKLISQFELLEENPLIFNYWLQLVTTIRTSGKRVHNLRLVTVMQSHGVENVLTLNPKDFPKVAGISVKHPNWYEQDSAISIPNQV